MLYIIIGLLTGVIYTTYKWYKTYNEYIEYKEKIIREHQMIKEKFAELKNATETYEKTNDSYSRLNKNEPWRILSECNVIQQVAYNVENSYVITDFSELETAMWLCFVLVLMKHHRLMQKHLKWAASVFLKSFLLIVQ